MTGTLQPFKQSSPEVTYSKPVKETYDMQKLMHGGKRHPSLMPAERSMSVTGNQTIKEVTGENFFTKYDSFY